MNDLKKHYSESDLAFLYELDQEYNELLKKYSAIPGWRIIKKGLAESRFRKAQRDYAMWVEICDERARNRILASLGDSG